MDALAINEAAQTLYQFFWNELCDWYIELSKPVLYGDDADARRATQHTLVTVLDGALRLLHPFIPFASEEIWQSLPLGDDRPEGLIIAPYPRPGAFPTDEGAEADVGALIEIITGVRNVRGELDVPPGKPIAAVLRVSDDATAALLEGERVLLGRTARLGTLTIQVGGERPRGAAMQLAGAIEVHVPLTGLIDFDDELARLDKAIAKEEKGLAQVSRKLANPRFVQNAPEDIVEKERQRQADHTAAVEKLTASRARIEALAAAE